MNRINPLFIALILLFLGIALAYKSYQLQRTIDEEQYALKKLTLAGKKIHALQSRWKDKKAIQKRIQDLVRNPLVKRYITHQEKRGERFILRLDNLDNRSAKDVTGVLFNSIIPINSFSFTQKNKKLTITVELRL